MPNSSELRQRARASLGGNIFSTRWIYALVACIIQSAIVSVISGFPLVGSIAVLILMGPLSMGLCQYFLNSSIRKEGDAESFATMFNHFSTDFGGNAILGILTGLFTFLWSLLFIFPGIIKSYSYAMAYYIKIDHPEYSATQAITESRRMMNGYKFKLFCLDLSFIGWYIVGFLACCVGTFWVNPYAQASRAEFYLALKSKAETEGEIL
ncbi:MAG: DUF975 family protein [Clostridia bacterium]|nr:DUF975 family protein [Clostridia bacterium]